MEQTTESSAPVNNPASSAAEIQQDQQTQEVNVKLSDHKRALEDMQKFKREALEAKTRIEEMQTQKLREQGEWKTLAEREKELRQAAEQKASKLNDALYQSKKFDEVYKEATKAGLRPEAFSDIELVALDGIEVELTSTGRMLVHGAESFVQELKRKRPHWFSNSMPPKVNPGGNSSPPTSSAVTPEMIFKAEKEGNKAMAMELTKLYVQQKKR